MNKNLATNVNLLTIRINFAFLYRKTKADDVV